MPDLTARLDLPLIKPSQAQKHVTHNEALQLLDGLVQAVLEEAGAQTPPFEPVTGQLFALGANPSGDWTGEAGKLALRTEGAWIFITPQAGWRAWDKATGRHVVYDDVNGWVEILHDHNNLPGVGINATADATNRLAVASAATLLSHEGAGHQLKINKAADTDTASLLFQSNWTGHAEMGLLGGDDFTVKVSADGSTFLTGLQIARSTGAVTLPGGWAGTGSAAGRLGGQTVAMVCERNGNVAAGTQLAFGNGSTDTPGAIMPFAGEVLALTVAAAAGTAGTNVFSMAINKVEVTTHQVTLNYSGSGVESAVASFLPSPLAFAPGDTLAVHVNTVSPVSKVTATIFAAFT